MLTTDLTPEKNAELANKLITMMTYLSEQCLIVKDKIRKAENEQLNCSLSFEKTYYQNTIDILKTRLNTIEELQDIAYKS